MINYEYLLSLNIFSPLIGTLLIAIILLFANYNKQQNQLENNFARIWPNIIGLIFASIPILITSLLWLKNSIFTEKHLLAKNIFEYYLEVDGISILMLMLSSFICIICLITFWLNKNYSKKHPSLGVMLILALQTCCLGVFSAKDLILFYIFFEASLIPMLFIIGIWGRENRVYASLKLFIYTVFGSIFFLFVIIYLKTIFQSSNPEILAPLIANLSPNWQNILWVCMFIAFAIKVPTIPFHTWLPDAHVQAPTFGSIILAGVLIKMGGYAMIRFLIPMFPESTEFFSHFVCILSVVGIIYGSLLCIAQKDLKKLIAYSSVAHMGYVNLGIFAPCSFGYAGAVFQMISHGFISSALFLSVGIIYDRLHSLEIIKIHSLSTKMPFLAITFMIFTLGSVGLPGTSGFIGEFLVIFNAANRSSYLIYAILGATGVILGAIYMLILYKNIFFKHQENINTIGDDVNYQTNLHTSKKENIILSIFAIMIIYFGLYPKPILEKIQNIKNIKYFNCSQNLDIQKINNKNEVKN